MPAGSARRPVVPTVSGILVVGLCFSGAPAAGQPSAVSHAIPVTHELSDDDWEMAPSTSAFVEREPAEGRMPSQHTEFRVAYDAATLYVRVRAHDTQPDAIVGYLTRRDDDSPSDWIRVLIDSFHDRRTAYEFGVNAAGVKEDRYWFDDHNKDDSWDAVWDVRVARDASGWTAEFRIPFSQLRFPRGEIKTLGFAVSRQIGRLNETSTWPLLARSANGYVSSFGELDGVSMTTSPKRAEIVPYTVTTLTRQPTGGNPLVKPSSLGEAVGLDLKYALTPGLTLTASVNPDFGQVEADPAVVNLSAFESFFAERRPFFVEGSGNFQFGLDCPGCNGLFYSRRIGRSPQGIDDLPSGPTIFTDSPAQTTIVEATKLTGRVGRFSLGALQAATTEEFGRVLDGASQSRVAVEPLTSYSVGRVRREFTNQSSFGFMTTATNRQRTGDLRFLPRSSYAAGADWDVRFARSYSLTGNWIASTVRGDPEAITRLQENSRHYFQRPDAIAVTLDPTRRALNGTAGRLGISKIGGERLRFNSSVSFKSPGFDINDLGFFRRADHRNVSNWVQLRDDKPSRWFRSRNINVNQWASWNYDGDPLDHGGNVNGSVRLANNWQAGGGLGVDFAAFDDRLTRGGPGGRSNRMTIMWSNLTSDDRHPVFLNLFAGHGADGLGSWFGDINPDVTVRPMRALTLTTGVRFNRNVNDYQWVSNVSDVKDHYVFAHLNQTTVRLTQRVNYTITPTLSIQLFAEPLVSGAGYGRFKELVDGRAPAYGDRYAPFAYADNPDFNYKSFRTTNVLRWEYRPGSTFFVVWQQARANSATYGDFRFARDFGRVFGLAPQNVLLVKLAYWLNY